ncbi:hypothetical protein U9M48_006644 [Paspalum notatum var. saurae]|uniref:Uncharacterized protein n=1 Tax=Paspalum notatum var. saurae TaxID=547442 RepID=A0AAQ3Q053_PASNO
MASAFVTTASSLGVVAMAGPGWRCGKDAQFKLLLGRAANTLKRCPMPASNVNLEEEKPERSIRATASTVSGVRLLLLLCISWARRQEMLAIALSMRHGRRVWLSLEICGSMTWEVTADGGAEVFVHMASELTMRHILFLLIGAWLSAETAKFLAPPPSKDENSSCSAGDATPLFAPATSHGSDSSSVDETPEHWWERTPYTVGCLPLELEASDGNGGEQTGLGEKT